MSKNKPALIVKNKTASRNFILGESFQAGIVLEGWEVKSLRNGKIDVKNSYVNFKNDEAWLFGIKIDPPASDKAIKQMLALEMLQNKFSGAKTTNEEIKDLLISFVNNLKSKKISAEEKKLWERVSEVINKLAKLLP